jgi:hypothetical protein
MGFAANSEKRMFGATTKSVHAYMQTKENYNLEVLGGYNAFQIKETTKLKNVLVPLAEVK